LDSNATTAFDACLHSKNIWNIYAAVAPDLDHSNSFESLYQRCLAAPSEFEFYWCEPPLAARFINNTPNSSVGMPNAFHLALLNWD
jgi:hypothetical protein